MSGSPYNIQDFGPSDLMTNEVEWVRRVKFSSEDSLVEFALADKAHSFTGSHLITAGQNIALNMDFASNVVISRVTTDSGLSIFINDDHATGLADGVVPSRNLNVTSDDFSPSTSQIYYDAVTSGNVLSFGNTQLDPFIIVGEGSPISAVVNNSTGSDKVVTISVLFKEIGLRSPLFGLQPNTQLEPLTEMSNYG